jgi:predicted DsbA family dithiol-disulfide isomerase
MSEPLRIDIWSDIACPWCYVGKRRLETAVRQFPHPVEVIWHSFQLDPSLPRTLPDSPPYVERLARKYSVPVAEAEAMIARMVQTAAQDGLAMDFEHVRPGNTFDAHRLLHLAKQRGLQDALEERLFAGYLCEGQAIGEPDVLLRLAAAAGLDVDETQGVLAGDAFAREVQGDIAQARALGVSGVPFFVIGERYGVSGAQPAETLLAVLARAWEEAAAAPEPGAHPEGAACGPDGCD